jgi:hypothetical protein
MDEAEVVLKTTRASVLIISHSGKMYEIEARTVTQL